MHGGGKATTGAPGRRDSAPLSRRDATASRRPADAARGQRMLVHVVPGLEDVADDEIRTRFPGTVLVGAWRRFDARTSLLEYRSTADPCAWRFLDTTEDVFLLAIRAAGIPAERTGLAALAAATLTGRELAGALATFTRCAGRPRSFRVVARKAGSHAFRRVDAQQALERALLARLPGVHLVEDGADAEFWLTIIGTTALVGLRLSTAAMRGHRSDFRSLPASLKPSVARAMARFSAPHGADRVLDPMCGAGTLLIERARLAPYARLLGGDREPEAVAVARRNASAAGLTISVERWDALALPLPDASVDVILTNPPFGRQLAIPGGDAFAFYRRLLREAQRVLTPGGRLVLITSQVEAMSAALRPPASRLCLDDRVPVLVRGEAATIYVARRGSEPP